MDEEEVASVNSEIRFMVLELMKLAARKGTTFDDELEEFVANAYKLHSALSCVPDAPAAGKRVAAAGKSSRR